MFNRLVEPTYFVVIITFCNKIPDTLCNIDAIGNNL